MTETGSAPTGSYLPLAFEGENYKVPAGTLVESGEISFRANLNNVDFGANSALGVQIPTMAATVFNVGNKFDTSTSKFTPGVAGRYLLTAAAAHDTDETRFTLYVLKNGAQTLIFPADTDSAIAGALTAGQYTAIVEANDTDYFQMGLAITAAGGGGAVSVNVEGDPAITFFAGYKI